jgi:hypothetical protein
MIIQHWLTANILAVLLLLLDEPRLMRSFQLLP